MPPDHDETPDPQEDDLPADFNTDETPEDEDEEDDDREPQTVDEAFARFTDYEDLTHAWKNLWQSSREADETIAALVVQRDEARAKLEEARHDLEQGEHRARALILELRAWERWARKVRAVLAPRDIDVMARAPVDRDRLLAGVEWIKHRAEIMHAERDFLQLTVTGLSARNEKLADFVTMVRAALGPAHTPGVVDNLEGLTRSVRLASQLATRFSEFVARGGVVS